MFTKKGGSISQQLRRTIDWLLWLKLRELREICPRGESRQAALILSHCSRRADNLLSRPGPHPKIVSGGRRDGRDDRNHRSTFASNQTTFQQFRHASNPRKLPRQYTTKWTKERTYPQPVQQQAMTVAIASRKSSSRLEECRMCLFRRLGTA
jgi:hypothetical protein